jgi:hypothetical protein
VNLLIEDFEKGEFSERIAGLAVQFAESGMRRAGAKAALVGFQEWSDKCASVDNARWCRDLIRAAGRARPYDYWILERTASDLALNPVDESSVRDALEASSAARRAIGSVPAANSRQAGQILDWIEARAMVAYGELGVFSQVQKGRAVLTRLASETRTSQNVSLRRSVYEALIDAAILGEDRAGAKSWLDQAERELGKPEMIAFAPLVPFADGRMEETELAGAEVERLASDRRIQERGKFWVCLAKIMLASPDAGSVTAKFLDSTIDPLQDYVRLLYYWHLKTSGEEAKAERHMEDRWALVEPLNWPKRPWALATWREMLIGRYAGKVKSHDIFSALDGVQKPSPALPLVLELQIPRNGLKCEAHFYEALYLLAQGDANREAARRHLQSAVSTGRKLYLEHMMARYLLQRL